MPVLKNTETKHLFVNNKLCRTASLLLRVVKDGCLFLYRKLAKVMIISGKFAEFGVAI